jgi:hypothetical protein
MSRTKIKVTGTYYTEREGTPRQAIYHLLNNTYEADDAGMFFGFPAWIVDTGPGGKVVLHQSDCEEETQLDFGDFWTDGDDDYLTLSSSAMNDYTGRIYLNDSCCDNPDIVTNTAMNKSFRVCRNCKKEVNDRGIPV